MTRKFLFIIIALILGYSTACQNPSKINNNELIISKDVTLVETKNATLVETMRITGKTILTDPFFLMYSVLFVWVSYLACKSIYTHNSFKDINKTN